MNIKIDDLMTASVVTTEPHKTLDHVRRMLQRNKVGAIPVVDSDGQPVGIVSATDVIAAAERNSPVSRLMSKKVYTVPRYGDPSAAARVMRNHKIHHAVVTHEHRIVGMVSAFDLLRLVEDHRFVAKAAPTPSRRRASKRA